MTKTPTCLPACSPNAAGDLPLLPPAGPGGPAPIATVTGVDCNGAPVVVTGSGVVQSVPHPTSVQLVKLCNPGEFDHNILCDPATGERVIVVTSYSVAGVPTVAAYTMGGLPYPGVITALADCGGSGEESDPVEMCDNGATSFIRWVVKKDGSPTGVTFDTRLDGSAYIPVGAVTFGNCEQQCTTVSETGYLADPSSASLTAAQKCNVTEVIIDGVALNISLPAFWSPQSFVDAVNAAQPGTLQLLSNGDISSANAGDTINSLQIVCTQPDFEENFATSAVPVYQTLAASATQPGATTTYTYINDGGFLGPAGRYSFARVRDLRPQCFDMGLGAGAVDASGNPDGLVMAVNGDPTPGEFYRQTATGLIIGQEYEFSVWIANANGAVCGVATPGNSPDVTLRVETLGNVPLATINTGPILYQGTWRRWNVKFVAQHTSVNYFARNNSPVVGGNDVLVDRIAFSRVSRQDITFTPRRRIIDVEIIKEICPGQAPTIRVFSPDGATQYTIPDPSGMLLHLGNSTMAVIAASQVAGKEYDQQETTEYYCVAGETWIKRTRITFDNALSTETGRVVEWSNGSVTQQNQPVGAISAGACAAVSAGAETDVVMSGPYAICVDNAGTKTTHYMRQRYTADNSVATGALTLVATEYSSSGVAWTAVAPTGVISMGACTVVAVAPRTFRTSVQDVPAGGNLSITPGVPADLVSVAVRNRSSTTATIQVNGGVALPLDNSESWGTGGLDEDGATLSDTINIAAGNGVIRVTTLRRLP